MAHRCYDLWAMDKRIHIVLPEEVVKELDRIAGKRGRSHFIEEALSSRLRHERQMAAIREVAANPVKFDLELSLGDIRIT